MLLHGKTALRQGAIAREPGETRTDRSSYEAWLKLCLGQTRTNYCSSILFLITFFTFSPPWCRAISLFVFHNELIHRLHWRCGSRVNNNILTRIIIITPNTFHQPVHHAWNRACDTLATLDRVAKSYADGMPLAREDAGTLHKIYMSKKP